MNDRRKSILLIAFAGMVVLVVADRLWRSWYEEPLSAAEGQVDRLDRQIQEAKLQVRRLKKRQQQLAHMRETSLPADVDTARTLYQGWLTDLVESVELDGRHVDSNQPRSGNGYLILPFSLRGRGTLEQLTVLLFRFYRAPHLHRIGTLTITPIAGSRQVSLTLAIEAVLIEGTERSDSLVSGTAEVLASEDLDAYATIARRNIFSTSGGIEATEHTALTAIVWVDETPEAWFTNRLAGKVDKLRQGDQFWVGALRCQIAEISLRDVVLLADDRRWLLTLDDRLADATAVPPEY